MTLQQILESIERSDCVRLMDKCNTYYQYQLRNHPQKMDAINYLKQRGLTGRIVRDFGIGYAPPGWNNVISEFGDIQLLTDCGMVIHGDNNAYDRFRNRIMFPIHDIAGMVAGFGGRVLNDDKPKYLNSPETVLFHKSNELYGLYQATRASKRLPRLLIVEGNMDVVTLHQFGIACAVATMGTACGVTHLFKAFRYTDEIVFCFDGDKAGITAARRALDAAIQVIDDSRTVRFMFLPADEDPDSLVRKIGAEAFTTMIYQAMPLANYIMWLAADGLDIGTIEGKALLIKNAAAIAHSIKPGIHRQSLLDQLESATGLPSQSIIELAFSHDSNN